MKLKDISTLDFIFARLRLGFKHPEPAAALLACVTCFVPTQVARRVDFPKSAGEMECIVGQLAPALLSVGVAVQRRRTTWRERASGYPTGASMLVFTTTARTT